MVMIVYTLTFALTLWGYSKLPTGFLPSEDQGYLIAAVQLPDASSQARTIEVIDQINSILSELPGVETWFTLGGTSLLEGSQSSNAATVFVRLAPWEKRTTELLQQDAIIGSLNKRLASIKDAFILVIAPPAIQGLGVSGGFEMQIEDRSGVGLDELQNAVNRMVSRASKEGTLTRVNSTFRAGVPQLYADVARDRAMSMQVPIADIFGTMQAALGSAYVNDFNKFGRTYRVSLQADANYRDSVDDIRQLKVRNASGEMVSLGSLMTIKDSFGPQIIRRFNLYPAATITGASAAGQSSGQSLLLMEQIADAELSDAFGFDWSGVSLQERNAKGEAIYVFGLAVLLVYLVLAFLYESWILPFAVILVVPLGLLGTVASVSFAGMDNNIYVQIGIVLVIALASKNAILIVEFARDLRQTGATVFEATIKAAKMRFRPILMTSIAFILGVLPLVFATGAAAASRRALGTAVCGGMITSTVLAVFFTPIFFAVFQKISESRLLNRSDARSASSP